MSKWYKHSYFFMTEALMTWVPPSINPKDCEALMTWVPPSNNPNDCGGNLSYTSIRLPLILCVNISYPWFRCTPDAKYFTGFFRIPLNPFLRCPEVIGGAWRVKDLSLNFDRQLPMLFIFMFVQDNQKLGVVTKNKIDNPRFVDEETIPLVLIMIITVHQIQAG